MKNIFKLLLVFSFSITVFAQTVSITEPVSVLVKGTERYLMPKISPDGNRVTFAGANFNSLYLVDFTGLNQVKISDLDASGWNVQWAPTSDCFASRVNFWTDNTRSKTSAAYVFYPDGTNKNISGIQNEINTPFWSYKGSSINWKENDTAYKSFNITDNTGDFSVYSEGNKLLMKNGDNKTAQKEFQADVLSSVLSPNGTRAALHVAGYGIYVYDFQTGQVYSFGEGETPAWVNDEVLVCMKIKDDGYKILDGDIYCYRYDGKLLSNLTADFNNIAMYPSASSGGKIVFQSSDGSICKMVISLQ